MSFFKKLPKSYGKDREHKHYSSEHHDVKHHSSSFSEEHVEPEDDSRLIDHVNEHHAKHGHDMPARAHHQSSSHMTHSSSNKPTWGDAVKTTFTPSAMSGGVIIGVAVVLGLVLFYYAGLGALPSGIVGVLAGVFVMLMVSKFTSVGRRRNYEDY